MSVEEKYLNESMKSEIKSIHYQVKREIEDVESLLKEIHMGYEFQDTILASKMPEILKHFDDIKSGLTFLKRLSKTKMVFDKKKK